MTGVIALVMTWVERRHRVRREHAADQAALEEPVRLLRVEAVDHRRPAPTETDLRNNAEMPVVWTLRLTNPSSTALTVDHVTVTHVFDDGQGSTTPWGTVVVGRTLDPGTTVDRPKQRGFWRSGAGAKVGHQVFDVQTTDPAGRRWSRASNGTITQAGGGPDADHH